MSEIRTGLECTAKDASENTSVSTSLDRIPSEAPQLNEFDAKKGPVNDPPQGALDDPIKGYWAYLNIRKDEDKHLWRKQYLQKSFYLVGFVLYFSFFVIVSVGTGLLDITETVVVTLLASTVAEVIGILIVAFNWLYPDTRKDRKQSKQKERKD